MTSMGCACCISCFFLVLASVIGFGIVWLLLSKDVEGDVNKALAFVEKEAGGAGKAVEESAHEVEKFFNNLADTLATVELEGKCGCRNVSCVCCIHLEVGAADIDDTACLHVTYLPEDVGVALALWLNGQRLLNKEISVRYPPAFCVPVPFLKKAVSVCLEVSDLDIKDGSVSGCIGVEVKVVHLEVAEVNLGCYGIPGSFLPSGRGVMSNFLWLVSSGILVLKSLTRLI